MSDILQEYLNLGLLDIGEDDSRLESLRLTARDLAQAFRTNPRLGVYHTLVVFAPDVAPDDASFLDVAQRLEIHWKTYRNRFKDVPRQLFKAVSLEAVRSAIDSNENLKFAVAYAVRTVFRPGAAIREQKLLAEFAAMLDAQLEEAARNRWEVQASTKKSEITAAAAPKVTKIDRDPLEASILAACGPNGPAGAIQGANPHWPPAGQSWSTEFAPRLSETVASAIEQALLRVAGEIGKQNKGLVDLLGDMAPPAVAHQIQLLWWRKTLYSTKLGQSYRQLKPSAAMAITMAIDMQSLLAGVSPLSAEYLLREAVEEVESNDLVTPQVLADVATGIAKCVLEPMPITTEKRKGLQTLAERLIQKARGDEAMSLGDYFPLQTEKPADLARRLLQELQSLHFSPTAIDAEDSTRDGKSS
jgi:hypothetical protein